MDYGRSLLAATIFVSAQTAPTLAASFDSIVSFGDSLSDVGNVFAATHGVIPAPPYFGGRFSNGDIWLDDLATNLGLPGPVPSLAGGGDYAFGGATTGLPATDNPAVPNLVQQVASFGTTAAPNALYTFTIGANDLSRILADIAGGGGLAAALGAAAGAAAVVAHEAEILRAEGAKDLMLFEVPDLGVTPAVTADGPLAAATATYLSLFFDRQVALDLQPVEAAGLSVIRLDTFALVDSVVADPGAYGFSNAADACYVGPLTGGGTVCSSPGPGQYLFWDDRHPTAAAGKLLGAAAAAAVPEPSSWAMLAVGFAALGLAGLRARRGALAATVSA